MGKTIVKKWIILSVTLFTVFTQVPQLVNAQTETVSALKIAVLPFSPIGLDEDQSETIATMINRRLANIYFVESFDEVDDALDEVDCDDEEKWADRICVQEAGEEMDVAYVLAGSISKVGNLFVTEVALHNIVLRVPQWSKQYRMSGTIDSYFLSIPQKIAEDVADFLGNSISATGGTYAVSRAPALPELDNGIVKGPTIGVHGLFAMGKVKKRQSPAGFQVMYLHPTTEKSQVRLLAGIPTFSTDNNPLIDEKDYPDVQICLEHEWGWKKTGVSAGLMYSNLSAFSGPDAENNYSSPFDTLLYDTYHSLNFVVSLRGGRPSGCFRGKISFPFVFVQRNEFENGIFEYSIFGVFGYKNTKVGIGNIGHFTRREPDRLTNGVSTITVKQYENSFSEYDRHLGEVTEFYTSLPTLKIAHLFGEHIVVNIVLELGGIIIPRFTFNDWMKPYIGFDFVYSFGKLLGPNVMDGTF